MKRVIAKHKAKQKIKTYRYIGKIKMTTTRDEHKMTNYTG